MNIVPGEPNYMIIWLVPNLIAVFLLLTLAERLSGIWFGIPEATPPNIHVEWWIAPFLIWIGLAGILALLNWGIITLIRRRSEKGE